MFPTNSYDPFESVFFFVVFFVPVLGIRGFFLEGKVLIPLKSQRGLVAGIYVNMLTSVRLEVRVPCGSSVFRQFGRIETIFQVFSIWEGFFFYWGHFLISPSFFRERGATLIAIFFQVQRLAKIY